MRPRQRSLGAASLVIVAGLVSSAAGAADGWPEVAPPLPDDWRGPGGGLAILPAALWWLVVLAWVKTVDWVHRDATKQALAPAFWSTVCGLPLPLVAVAAWWIPSALAGLVLMLLAWGVPVVVYALARNRKVAEPERILTVNHAWRTVARLVAPLGIELAEPVRDDDVLPAVELAAAGGRDDAENAARLAAAKATPGFEELRRQLVAAVVARASTTVVEVGGDTTVRHEVDGVWGKPRVRQPPRSRKEKEVWVEVPPSSRDVGEAVMATAQAICGLPAAAVGRFAIKVDGKPQNCRASFGQTGAGRQLAIQIESPTAVFRALPALGMPAPMVTRIGDLLAAQRGLLIVSSPAGSGLSTTFDLVVESGDRLLRDFISIEDAAWPPREIQNVKPVRFDARTGVTPLAALANAMREYPAVIVARDIHDKALMVELVRLVGEGKLVLLSLKASDAVEAMGRVLACGVDPKSLGAALLGSLSQRLVRRLCPKCREELPPPEQLLARLKLTAEQLPKVFRASADGCRLCQGSGYLGRTGLFELASGGTLRRLIAAGGSPEQLRQAAVKDGMQPLRDAGLQLVVDGTTSLEELQRSLAGKPAAAPGTKPAAAPAGASPGPAAVARKKP
jgi:hypothetical protein